MAQEIVMAAFPTYNRVGNVQTWKHVPGNTWAVVEPFQAQAYRTAYPDKKIYTLPSDGMTITDKRKWIVEYARTSGARWLFMLEDDLTGFAVRSGKTAGGNIALKKSEWSQVFKPMLETARAHNIVQLGLSQRQSNFRYPENESLKYSCKITEFVLLDLHAMRALGVQYDTALPQFEDFDLTIQILLRGGRAALYLPAAFEHVVMGENAGGHQSEGSNRAAQCEQATRLMVAKYPEFVAPKQGRLFVEPDVDWKALRAKMK